MHIHNALSVAENSDTEWFHNIIVNLFQVVLVDALVLPPHALSQLKLNPPLEVDAFIKYQLGIPVISNTVFLPQSLEVVHGYLPQRAGVPLTSCKIPRRLLTLYQNHLLLFNIKSSYDVLSVGYPLIHVHRRGDINVLKHSAS